MKKTKRRRRTGRGMDPNSSDSIIDTESPEDDEHGKGRTQRKEKHRRKVMKNRKGKTKRYDSSNDNESDTLLDLEFILPLNDLLTKAVEYRNYRLRTRDSDYTSQVAQKITQKYKRLDFQMGDTTFMGDDLISIIDYLQRFKIDCDQNGF